MLKLKRFILSLALLVVLAGGGLAWWFLNDAASPQHLSSPVVVEVPRGSSLRAVADQMGRAGVLRHPEAFVLLAHLRGQGTALKAGHYRFDGDISPEGVLQKLVAGDVVQHGITFIEGQRFDELHRALLSHEHIVPDTAELSEAGVARLLGIEGDSVEGWLFPSTYHFGPGSRASEILKMAHATMRRELEESWAERSPELPLETPYEALILASIIEKETGDPRERPLIGGVFVNRLNQGYKLQTDPTVIYGIRDRFKGNLTRRDLTTDTPWNTYTRYGLPPTPIAMPGRAALDAATRPEATRALYFVSRNDGTHVFSENLADHNAAVNHYQRRGR